MAKTVESPGITSAKEEAAAILFAREQQSTPVMTAPAPEQSVRTVSEPLKYKTFAHYHEPEAMPVVRPQTLDTTALRPYQNFDETPAVNDPQVVRPYIDSSEYLSSAVAATSMSTTTPEATVTQDTNSVAVVESPLDTKLEEGVQYVVKFKKSTIIAASILASIFLLMTVLFVVNIVNLVTMSAEVNALTQETVQLEQQLQNGQVAINQEKSSINNASHTTTRAVSYESTYQQPNQTSTDSSFFDWLCHSLSRLFS